MSGLCEECLRFKETGDGNYGTRLGLKYRYTGTPKGYSSCSRCWKLVKLRDVDGNDVSVSISDKEKRAKRLESNKITLYHQTDSTAAREIFRSQKFRRGNKYCYAGSGIYFAESPEETNNKAINLGIVLKATVKVGNVKTIYSSDKSLTFSKLLKEGYDSICIRGMRTGTEYVVYNYDQIVNIKYN